MTKEEYLSLASEKYEALQTLNTNLNFYDYEKTFDELWTELGRAVLERNIGKIPNDYRKLPFFEDEAKYKLLTYLKNNAYRMKYDEYRQRGLMISSGPIESAHRTVLQVRMKLSGQYWSEAGCDKMIKVILNCTHISMFSF